MEPPAKSGSIRNLLRRLLLLGVSVFFLRFVYVVTVYGGSCASGDYCLFSSPGESIVVAGAGVGASEALAAAAKASVSHTGQGSVADATPAQRALWTTREWRKAVEFYSSLFQGLAGDGFLSPASKALCIGTPAGYEVLALREIGLVDAVGVAKKSSPPLVVAAAAGTNRDPVLRLPFKNGTFSFIFAGAILDGSSRPADLAAEIARALRPISFLVVLTASAGDAYSVLSLTNLFPGFSTVRSREIVSASGPLREVVFQKREAGEIQSLTGNNSPEKCSIAEHKLRILQLAEPLIEEEPLKPWITLKRNLKNIKYLSSMADISFKSRYVYVDVGARSYGSSIGSWFRKQYPKQNHTFDIYAIEADSAFHGDYATRKGVTLLPFAAWVRNETLTFEVNHDAEEQDESKGQGMGRIRAVTSSDDHISAGKSHAVPGFDLAAWLKRTVTERDYVVMKMDVEGTEFDLLPRLFETGSICLIDELFLECHYNRWQKCCPGQRSPKYRNTYGECLKLFTSLRQSGVLVHQWW